MEQLLVNSGHDAEKWFAFSAKTFEFACNARAWFENGDLKVKKEILSAIGSNLVLKDKKLLLEARIPFLLIEKSLLGTRHGDMPFEPNKFVAPQGKRELLCSLSPTMRSSVDEVRTYKDSLKQIPDYGKIPNYSELVRRIYRWVWQNDKDRTELESILNPILSLLSDYQKEAA